jgi:hypothetical protein
MFIMDGEDQCLNNKRFFTYDSLKCHMVDFGIVKWHNHKSLEFDGMDFFKY